jgi:hypothetical protein
MSTETYIRTNHILKARFRLEKSPYPARGQGGYLGYQHSHARLILTLATYFGTGEIMACRKHQFCPKTRTTAERENRDRSIAETEDYKNEG